MMFNEGTWASFPFGVWRYVRVLLFSIGDERRQFEVSYPLWKWAVASLKNIKSCETRCDVPGIPPVFRGSEAIDFLLW